MMAYRLLLFVKATSVLSKLKDVWLCFMRIYDFIIGLRCPTCETCRGSGKHATWSHSLSLCATSSLNLSISTTLTLTDLTPSLTPHASILTARRSLLKSQQAQLAGRGELPINAAVVIPPMNQSHLDSPCNFRPTQLQLFP